MRRIVGYIDGRAQWSDNVPAEPLSVKGWMFGELIVGNPGYRARNRAEASRQTSRRYRAAHPEKLNEYQREYRARKRAA